jgi:hypothetical protein
MAGKRQHYIPRFLQRGFLADEVGDAERVWLYRRDTLPTLVGIRDVGVEDWFYSRRNTDGGQTLDDVITNLERAFAPDLASLRALSPGSIAPAETSARLIAHLTLRTAHLRQVMSIGAERIGAEVSSLLGDPERMRRLLGLDEHTPPTRFREAIQSALQQLPLVELGVPEALIQRVLEFIAREQFDREIAPQLSSFMPTLLSVAKAAGEIREAHNRALAQMPVENGWVAELRAFHWMIEAADNAILPDCVALAFEADGSAVPLLMSDRERAVAVVLPLAPNRLLVGRRLAEAQLSLADFNIHAAASSESLFVGCNDQVDADLAGRIGARASAMVGEVIETALSEHGASSPPAQRLLPPTAAVSSEPRRFEISLLGWGD